MAGAVPIAEEAYLDAGDRIGAQSHPESLRAGRGHCNHADEGAVVLRDPLEPGGQVARERLRHVAMKADGERPLPARALHRLQLVPLGRRQDDVQRDR